MDEDKTVQQAGDLANRIVRRREELGLTRERLAQLANIDPGYLEYVEQTWVETPSADVLRRLADALRPRRGVWLAAISDVPPGRGGPVPILCSSRSPMSSASNTYSWAASVVSSLLPSEVPLRFP